MACARRRSVWTERQAQVLDLMVRGLSNRLIAKQLNLSEGTVKIHATAIFKVLGVTSRTQALIAASRYGSVWSLCRLNPTRSE